MAVESLSFDIADCNAYRKVQASQSVAVIPLSIVHAPVRFQPEAIVPFEKFIYMAFVGEAKLFGLATDLVQENNVGSLSTNKGFFLRRLL